MASTRDLINPVNDEMKDLRDKVLEAMSMKQIVKDILHALTYIHSKTDDHNDKITHRDIKPENILIMRNERDGKFVVKFTDFDSSKQLEVDERVSITTNVTTEAYKDPAIDNKKWEEEEVVIKDYEDGDVYATGVSLFEFLGDGRLVLIAKKACSNFSECRVSILWTDWTSTCVGLMDSSLGHFHNKPALLKFIMLQVEILFLLC